MDKNKTIFEQFENELEEYFEKEKATLNANKEYKNLKIKRHNIFEKSKNLLAIFEGEIDNITLTNDECYSLYELIKINYDIQEIENENLFFLGAKDMYFFLKKLEIIA